MKKMLLLASPLLLVMAAFDPENSFTVHGVVTDENGKNIPYTTVLEKGTKNSVVTDATGTFTIRVSTEKAVLVISALGYNSKEIKIKGRSNLNIALNTSAAHLEEVVVTGFANAGASTDYMISKKASGISRLNAPNAEYKSLYNHDRLNGRYDSGIHDFNTEAYDKINENPFLRVNDNPLSTFLLMSTRHRTAMCEGF